MYNELVNKEMVVSLIKTDIADTLKMFGEYSFADKGIQEVMDVDTNFNRLKALSIADCKDVLVELSNGTEFEKQFVSQILMEFQDIPNENWDFLMESPELQEAWG